MIAADLDGNTLDDLVVDFGPGIGVWVWMNHASWVQIHESPRSAWSQPTSMSLVAMRSSFTSRGLVSGSGGTQPAGPSSTEAGSRLLAVGQVDGIAGKDLIVDFAGFGLWLYANDSGWTQLATVNATKIGTSDLDGNGQVEIIADYPNFGIGAYRHNVGWVQLHPQNAQRFAVGDIDGNRIEDLVVDFGEGYGPMGVSELGDVDLPSSLCVAQPVAGRSRWQWQGGGSRRFRRPARPLG